MSETPERQQYHGLREQGYPRRLEPEATPDTPEVIVRRQAKLVPALTEIHSHAPTWPVVCHGGVTEAVTDEQVSAWCDAAPERKRLAPAVARSLCFLDTFRPDGPEAA